VETDVFDDQPDHCGRPAWPSGISPCDGAEVHANGRQPGTTSHGSPTCVFIAVSEAASVNTQTQDSQGGRPL
jgi:hypothetical protein